MNAASFVAAATRVESPIHPAAWMRSPSAASRFFTIASMRALSAGVNARRTYSWPRISPSASSVWAMQRFQRGSISVVPVSTWFSANHSFTYGVERCGAASRRMRTRRYAFHVSSGVAVNWPFTPRRKSGCVTFTSPGGTLRRAA